MFFKKIIDLNLVYNILTKAIEGEELTYFERVMLYRFKDKLTDSESFEFTTNRTFSGLQLKFEKDRIEDLLNERLPINLHCNFTLKPVDKTNWELYQGESLFLDKLDTKLARRIAYDINVAIGIQVSRNSNK